MRDQNTILLAEDDPDDQEIIVHAFTEVGPSFNLHIVNNGKEAMDFLLSIPDNNLPCLIVLDYNMPELNGVEVLQKLFDDQRYKHIPKIILSTSANPKFIEECLEQGASAYKVKPTAYQNLLALAKEMMELCSHAS